MSGMPAVRWEGPGLPLALVDLPVPVVEEADDVLIRVRAAMFGAALVRAATVGHPKLTPPAVLGSLVAGEVAGLGTGVTHLRVGDVVTIDPHPACGECRNCADGQAALCLSRPRIEPGAFAEYVRIRPPLTAHVRPVPAGVTADAAVLTEIVACVLDATRAAGIGSGQDVLVLGCGPVALIQIQLALHAGAARVFCTVRHPVRRAAVAGLGAVPLDHDLAAVRAGVAELTGGRGAHVVVEAVGSAATYEQAFEFVRDGGTVVGFGGCPPGSAITLDPNELHYRRLRFVGSYHYPPGTFADALSLIADGSVDLGPVVTHRIPLWEAPSALDAARSPGCITMIVEP